MKKSEIRFSYFTSSPAPTLFEGVGAKVALAVIMLCINCINAQCLNKVNVGSDAVFACGIKSDGTLWGWGNNQGQLGDGTGVDHWLPTQITTASDWESIACGGLNTFVIKTDGTLWVTGGNNTGQLGLGIGSPNIINTLTQQGTANNWKQIGCSTYNAYGIKINGTLWGWGQNDGAQMGNNTCCSDQTAPIQIGTSTDWKQVATSNCRYTFAIKTNGTLWGWGTNNSCYPFGGSDISSWAVPTQYNADTNWDKVVCGYYHSLAIKTDGTLWGFGTGDYGESGYNPTLPHGIGPFQIPGTWMNVAAGFRFSMGIKSDGTLWSWGINDVGQLGDGTNTNHYAPYQISTATNWVSVSCGYQFTIALRSDGSLWSWGSNFYGELGNGTATTTQATPTAIAVPGCALDAPQFDANASLTLAPIPVMDQLQLTYKGKEAIETIIIYDLAGREVYNLVALGTNAFSTSFSTAALTSGSYILVVKNKTQVVASKQFVKE
jgi:alpha-tubulin suppressor-like RCC1 family protein